MLRVQVTNKDQNGSFDHELGILEFGRGPQRDSPRFVIKDQYVSRDHLQLEELSTGCIHIKNLSQKQPLKLPNGSILTAGAVSELPCPCKLCVGETIIEIKVAHEDREALEARPFDQNLFMTLARPCRSTSDRPRGPLVGSSSQPTSPDTIASWLETINLLQRSPSGSKEFYNQTARALVDLVNLELGMVLLKSPAKWEIAGHCATSDRISSRYSRTLLNHVIAERRTFYQDTDNMKIQANSLVNVEAVVVSPIFGSNDEVVGVLYGSRTWGGIGWGSIRSIEAQVVQLLAGAVGDNLARVTATRTRVQFEQFFSTELVMEVMELERDPALLEGRNQEVTILVSDLRGFTSLSERLGPETTCRVVRDIMERLTEQIVKAGGVIVDYAGDGILAMWNAPAPQSDHVTRACQAGLAMLRELPELNSKWQATIGTSIALGIGINTGPAQVGNTGSSRRLKYGPHGLTVNVASRVQDATKVAGVPLLISRSVRQRIPKAFPTRSVGQVRLKGISEEVELFELCDVQIVTTETISPGRDIPESVGSGLR